MFDDTVLVTSYVAQADLTDGALVELRGFLHRMGREAKQGEIGVVIDSTYLAINEYDSEER